jgi:hypothetical protein
MPRPSGIPLTNIWRYNMLDMSQLGDFAIVGLCTVLGFAIRLGKKFYFEKINPLTYLKIHHDRTIASVATMISTAIGAYMIDPSMSPISFVMMAYMADSIVNKTPSKEEAFVGKALK